MALTDPRNSSNGTTATTSSNGSTNALNDSGSTANPFGTAAQGASGPMTSRFSQGAAQDIWTDPGLLPYDAFQNELGMDPSGRDSAQFNEFNQNYAKFLPYLVGMMSPDNSTVSSNEKFMQGINDATVRMNTPGAGWYEGSDLVRNIANPGYGELSALLAGPNTTTDQQIGNFNDMLTTAMQFMPGLYQSMIAAMVGDNTETAYRTAKAQGKDVPGNYAEYVFRNTPLGNTYGVPNYYDGQMDGPGGAANSTGTTTPGGVTANDMGVTQSPTGANGMPLVNPDNGSYNINPADWGGTAPNAGALAAIQRKLNANQQGSALTGQMLQAAHSGSIAGTTPQVGWRVPGNAVESGKFHTNNGEVRTVSIPGQGKWAVDAQGKLAYKVG